MRLLIPSWKYCSKCDMRTQNYYAQKEKGRLREIEYLTIQNFRDVTKLYTIHEHIKNKKLHDKQVLVYDENNVIIGYR